MKDLHDLTQLLLSCWTIAGGDSRMPTSHGVLDRALKIAVDQNAFPSWARERLHFVDARTGLQCVELSSILDWAQTAELTVAPNPSYRYTELQITPVLARRLLGRLAVPEKDAKLWGGVLRDAVRTTFEEIDKFAPHKTAEAS